MAATALLYAVVAVIMPLVVPLVLGEDFDDSILIIQIVCGGLAFAAISSQMNSLLQGWGQLRQVAVISAITSISCLLGVAVAAIWWGGVGAAIALTASYILQVVLLAGIVVLQGRG
ncbi:polysaccharide biosynthesis protein [Rhodococcus pyridinivorans AK37]|uniref:Polysaccharide biosynthesis protein n=2 Tax=Rhodococcus TaxID=1827 RepID=H0JTU1_9NOCA|nr:polysaccharide biosynthesis protein [Rhodococcus pyridinivorans AK37]